MVGIPPAVDSDAEDVVWALQTAEALWKRNERVDAIVWLRRAAQAAGEAEDDDRALSLARDAAELAEFIAQATSAPATTTSAPPSDGPASVDAVEDLLRRSQVDIEVAEPIDLSVDDVATSAPAEEMIAHAPPSPIDAATERPPTAIEAAAPPSSPEGASLPLPPMPFEVEPARELPPPNFMAEATVEETLVPLGSAVPPPPPPIEDDAATSPAPDVQTRARSVPEVEAPPTAEVAHAGMLDPWAESTGTKRPESNVVASPRIDSTFEADEVVTSAPAPAARSGAPPAPKLAPPPAPPKPAPPSPGSPPPVPRRPPPPLPPRPKPLSTAPGAPPAPAKPPPPPKAPAPVEAPPPPPPIEAASPPAAPPPRVSPPAPNPPAIAADGALDLTSVEAFSDLPDDAREAFARAAKVESLARDEEVASFALVLVLEGSVDVAATIVEAPAQRLQAGAVLRNRGTLEHRVSTHLLCASENARVATWDDEAVAEAFRTCPWVEDDLCAAGDRVQALVGLTMGPLGERLDTSLREQVTDRLALRVLQEGEVFAEQGATIPGLLVVGIGELDLVREGAVHAALKSGEFLFATEVLGGGRAPSTARAGKGGALVMTADRHVAQELMVTCPPLLEIFAGM